MGARLVAQGEAAVAAVDAWRGGDVRVNHGSYGEVYEQTREAIRRADAEELRVAPEARPRSSIVETLVNWFKGGFVDEVPEMEPTWEFRVVMAAGGDVFYESGPIPSDDDDSVLMEDDMTTWVFRRVTDGDSAWYWDKPRGQRGPCEESQLMALNPALVVRVVAPDPLGEELAELRVREYGASPA